MFALRKCKLKNDDGVFPAIMFLLRIVEWNFGINGLENLLYFLPEQLLVFVVMIDWCLHRLFLKVGWSDWYQILLL